MGVYDIVKIKPYIRSMHQILADHDKQISIQHLRERSTERSCDVNRNEVAYFADVIKQVFGSSTQVPIRL